MNKLLCSWSREDCYQWANGLIQSKVKSEWLQLAEKVIVVKRKWFRLYQFVHAVFAGFVRESLRFRWYNRWLLRWYWLIGLTGCTVERLQQTKELKEEATWMDAVSDIFRKTGSWLDKNEKQKVAVENSTVKKTSIWG